MPEFVNAQAYSSRTPSVVQSFTFRLIFSKSSFITSNMKAVAYIRASTNPEMQKNSISIQEAIIAEFARVHGYELVDRYVEYASGKDDDRPEFNKALNRCVTEEVFLITWKVDRLSRSLSIFSRISDHLSRIRFAELGDSEPNIMVLSVLLGVAHQERINTGVRVKAAYANLKAQGAAAKWGNPRIAETAVPAAIAVRKRNAAEFNSRIQSIVSDYRKAGYEDLNVIAAKLNDELGLRTRRGQRFNYHNLYRIVARQAA